MVFFVPSTLGFIPREWKKDGTYTAETWPSDAVPLSDTEASRYWRQPAPELHMLGATANGRPAWVPVPPLAPASAADIEASRKRAYADPISGCDSMFAESSRMQVMGESGFEEVRARAIARFEEIQAQYPWPSK